MQKIMNCINGPSNDEGDYTVHPQNTVILEQPKEPAAAPQISPRQRAVEPYGTIELAAWDTTPTFTLEGAHLCKVLDVYDGDTFTVATNLPGYGLCRFTCRLAGIDTAEMRYPNSEPMKTELKHLAYKARNRVLNLLTNSSVPLESHASRMEIRELCSVSTKTVEINFANMDKYGRWLVNVPIYDTADRPSHAGSEELSQILIDDGLALAYDGGTKSSIHELLIE